MEQRRSQSIAQDKRFHFTVQIVGPIRRLQKDHVNLVLTRQLLRSGTSIGANVEEDLGRDSCNDFMAKPAVAEKEARETGYWSRRIRETQPHTQQELAHPLFECEGLLRMLDSIILATRRKLASADLRLLLRTHNSKAGEAVDPELRIQNSELSSD